MRYWTSDIHFGHQNIIEYCNRPYSSVDEMNADIIRIWNDTVDDLDDVIVVGDMCLGKIAETLPLVSHLAGRKTLICGNHDRCWDGHKKKGTWYEKYLDAGFYQVMTGWDAPRESGVYPDMIGNELVSVSHFPYTGDSGDEDRYSDWRPVDYGNWLIHGHVHDAWKVNGRMINVGWDIWNRPISDDEIAEIIKESHVF